MNRPRSISETLGLLCLQGHGRVASVTQDVQASTGVRVALASKPSLPTPADDAVRMPTAAVSLLCWLVPIHVVESVLQLLETDLVDLDYYILQYYSKKLSRLV